MRISPNRPTDKQIIEAINSGKSQRDICKQLGTHSKRVSQLHSKVKTEEEKIYHKKLDDIFIMNSF